MKSLNVKPLQETLHAGMCGPASLKMILNFYGVEKTEQELAELCNTGTVLGTNDQGLKNATESLGFQVEVKNNSTFSDIESWLEKDVPVIVDWFSRGRSDYSDSEVADGHYSVVVGLDDEYIYIQDPEIGGERKIKRDEFMKVWFDFTGPYIRDWREMIVRQILVIYRS
jgi:ABC-type bacteriocin/lantibiotic exporter with double-glycine peptidase domain